MHLSDPHVGKLKPVAGRQVRCTLPSHQLTDAREHTVLGRIGGQELHYPELPEWVERNLRAAADTDPDAAALLVEINRAYIETHPSGHSFQLVLRVREAHDPESSWRIYRGQDSGITWWGHRSEIGDYVRKASAAAIKALVFGEGACSSG
jgi:hypothetical protein